VGCLRKSLSHLVRRGCGGGLAEGAD